MIQYKFNEDKIINDLKEYIDKTYSEHYSGKYQATDMIIDAGHGKGFCIGNIMKYAKRCGKKDNPQKELQKIIHYAIIAMYVYENEKEEQLSLPLSLPPLKILKVGGAEDFGYDINLKATSTNSKKVFLRE